MDQFTFNLLPFLLTYIGCSVGQDDVLKGPVDAVMGGSVTLKALVEKKKNDIIIWNFRDRDEWVNVATLRESGLQVNDQYKGRASIDPSNGFLYLSFLNCDDSGDYGFNFVGSTVKTGEIKLRVLAAATMYGPTTSYPGAREQCADCFVPLVVCSAVIVMLLVGFLLLLYKMCNSKRSRTSNIEQSNIQERRPAVKCKEAIYDTLNLAPMDEDQTYSTLYCGRFEACSYS
ncbi:uncharacterized protein LOC121657126 [Melanotaenia boesemani]|uniref:uncharacterized protein LOC121657126 n=1 Tax=Melanotaenia boesemani TaxID=1250792 RepID=UPI001C052F81|nr:uncharacterized protein LOC121657126 [Melanotaenia boesemani]